MNSPIDRARSTVTTLRADPRTPVLAVVAAGWFLSLGVRMVYPAVIPYLRESLGFSLSLAGFLLATLWTAYALGQLPGGVLSDRFGERIVLAASTFVSGVTLGLVVAAGAFGRVVAVAGDVSLLFAATALFGLSTALYGVARFTILSRVYPDNDGMAIGVTMAAGDLGNAVLPPLSGFLAGVVAWQAGFAYAVPLFLTAGVGILLVVPAADDGAVGDETGDEEEAGSPEPSGFAAAAATAREVGGALRHRPVLVVAAIQTLGYCVWQAVTGFYPTYLVDAKGFSPATASIAFGAFFAMGAVIKPVTGHAYDEHGARRTLPVVFASLTGALVALPFVDSVVGVFAVTAPLSAVLGYASVTLTYLTDALPDAVKGSGLGVLRTGYMLVGAGSPGRCGGDRGGGLLR